MSSDYHTQWVLETPSGVRWLSSNEYTEAQIIYKVENDDLAYDSKPVGRKGEIAYDVVGAGKVYEFQKMYPNPRISRRNLKLLLTEKAA